MKVIRPGDKYQFDGNYGFTIDADFEVLEVKGTQETGLAVCRYADSDDKGILGFTNTFNIGLDMLRSRIK